MSKINTIWKNRKAILEGITNTILKNEFVEEIAKERIEICNSCEFKGDKCLVSGTGPCCNDCGCSLSLKTRALSDSCPKDKWKALLTEEEEDKLNKL
jgi:anaerobic ribonucleoside-triphosphate reductase